MKKTMTYLLLLAGTLLLAGCQKEGRFGSDKSLIHFSAATRPETKTAYGAEETVTENEIKRVVWQSIDWENGDVLRIFSNKAVDRYHSDKKYADYKVVNAAAGSSSTNPSTARLINANIVYNDQGIDPGVSNPSAEENDNVNGLLWGEHGVYDFYGIYPVTDCTDGATGKLNGTIGADQGTGDLAVNMPIYGYLTAASRVTTTEDGKGPSTGVKLYFDPAFTAFEVAVKSADEEIGINAVRLVSRSTALSGAFSLLYAYNEEDSKFTRTPSCPALVKDVNDYVGLTYKPAETISTTKTLTFTLFALPQDLTDLELQFTLSNGQTRYLALSDENGVPVEFGACKKHKIYTLAMPTGEWKLYLESEVKDWEMDSLNPKYGTTNNDGVIISAAALEFLSGAGTVVDRTEVTLASITTPLEAYFSVYAPTDGKWRITMKGNKASSFTLGSSNANVISSAGENITTVSADGGYIEGAIGQRVAFHVTPNSAARSGDSVELHFSVVVGDKEYSIHSDVTLSQLPLTVKIP